MKLLRVALRRLVGGSWLDRARQADVSAMRMLARPSDTAARALHAVHAVGVGPKMFCGQRTSTSAIRFYVVQKIARRALTSLISSRIDGLPVDVVESPPAFL
jgi:hypothetical protein